MIVKTIFLTGSMRSGTSALGKIIGSLEGVEFFYEPMIFVKLLLDPNNHRLLDDYIYSDLIMPALAGRNINLNRSDDSSIYNYKSEAFIRARMSKSWASDEIHAKYSSVNCLIKYPTYISQIASLEIPSFPSKKVYIFREPNGNLHSLLRKKWFSDEVISDGIRGEFRKVDGRNIPLWVENPEIEKFLSLDEQGRCLFYYNKTLSVNLDAFDVIVSYESLCNEPFQTGINLQSKLDVLPGEKTEELLRNMRPEKMTTLEIAKHNVEAYEQALANYRRVKTLGNV
jgi:hypothetical protein